MAAPEAAPAPPARRQRHSLLSRLVALIGLAFFLVELAIVGTFTGFYWWALREDRIDHLARFAAAAHSPVRDALLRERGAGPAEEDVDADLDAALEGQLPAVAAPDRFMAPSGAPVEVYVLTPGRAYRFSRAGLEPSDPPPDLAREVEAFLLRGELAPRVLPETGRIVRIEPLPLGGSSQRESHAVLYLETSLEDIERQVVTYGLVAFGTGALAILFTAMVSIGYLRRTLLVPLSRIIRADNAARRGDAERGVIDEGEIPDDEVGTIMRSRNHMLLGMIEAQQDLDRKNAELAAQREELRRWGRELERLVEDKTAALLRARDTLYRNEKLAALGRLAANVAHEINNPLASIAGYAEATRGELEASGRPQDEETIGALRTIEEQAFRCKDILKRLLALARVDPPRLQPVLVAGLVRDTVEFAEHALDRRQVEVRLDLPDGGGPEIQSDPGALQQVVLNLLENAADAAATGGAQPPWIAVSLLEGPARVGLRVEDNGQGVAPELRERVFDPFYTTKPVGRGTGLGLAICQSLLERLGGRIELEPRDPGRGASFVVWLPVEGPGAAAPPLKTGALDRTAAQARTAAHARPGAPSGAHVDGSALLDAHTRAITRVDTRVDVDELP